MATKTESITRELLDHSNNPSGLEAVLKTHARSKGPLYLALAAATTEMLERFDQVRSDVESLHGEKRKAQEELTRLEERRLDLQTKTRALEDQLSAARLELSQAQRVLANVAELRGSGFGEEELRKLRDTIGSVRARHGLSPEEAVATFLETVRRVDGAVSLDVETQATKARAATAKAEAERWETEAKRSEAHSKARTATIDLVDRLINEGVNERDFRQWANILGKAGVAPEALARALTKYTSLEDLCKEKGRQVDKLEKTIRQAKAALTALQDEQAEVKAGIAAIRDGALREMEQTGRMARQQINEMWAAARPYVELEQQAEALGEEIALARVLKSLDPEEWSQVPRWGIQRMIMGAIMWSKSHEPDLIVGPPNAVRFTGGTNMPWLKVRLVDVLLWALSGLLTEEDRRAALAGGHRGAP